MDYNSLLNSVNSQKWKRIGINRRAGVSLPLFSVYSKAGIGIGEIPDLKLVIDWCIKSGMSVIQLLPLNELGFDFSPYNSISTFALEPSYLSLKKLRGVNLNPFRKDLKEMRNNFVTGSRKVDYKIKEAKLNLLWKIFQSSDAQEDFKFQIFIRQNIHWLRYYSLFKVISKINEARAWTEWDLRYRYIAPLTLRKISRRYADEINFHYWIQWQLFEQFVSVRRYAIKKGILLMGDVPFLVSRNSVDVWAYKNYFKLNLSSGAPPDMYFAEGQKWGMPPYNWENIVADNYSYIAQRLKYAENFYDMFRIDHFIGLFRVWTTEMNSQESNEGLTGKFDPENERDWEINGSKILSVMSNSTSMLPCAEDLGTVPECSERVLKKFGVTGIDVQRWEKVWNDQYYFRAPEKYRTNAVAVISTHDSSPFPVWWEYEAGTVSEPAFRLLCEKLKIENRHYGFLIDKLFDKEHSQLGRLFWKKEISNVYVLLNLLNLSYDHAKEIIGMYLTSFSEKEKFIRYLGLKKNNYDINPEFIKENLEKISESASIFSIQLIMEYLYLDKKILNENKDWNYRINFPGVVNETNWSMVVPVSLEELNEMQISETIKSINKKTGRV